MSDVRALAALERIDPRAARTAPDKGRRLAPVLVGLVPAVVAVFALTALSAEALCAQNVDSSAHSGTAPAAETLDVSPEVERLLDLIEHRARLMPAVAHWKWQRNLPVTDPTRELQVLEQSSLEAAEAGIAEDGARAFVAAQMAVARDIQQAHHDAWANQPPTGSAPDLIEELRPAITATTGALLGVLPRVLPLLREAGALRTGLAQRLLPLGAGDASIGDLATALTMLRPTAPVGDRLARIRARGALRVGTTGDYAPFSEASGGGAFAGIDIDLARALAAELEVEVTFVATSWPTLMEDLQAGRFDIAMSGISRAPFRALVADFSAPYHVGGKTPIVRCADRQRFASLATIDQPDVRVVVNPGGTNERFTRATLTRAPLRVFPDNTRIFGEIAEGRADVMFTDAIEVQLQTALDPRLCAALPGRTLTFQEKGFLMPRDEDGAWLRFVDLWLAQVRGDGTLQATFDRHLREMGNASETEAPGR